MNSMMTDERTGIVYRRWIASSPEAVLLLVHGLGAHSGRWEFLSDFFLRNNISSYSIELKGFGETEGVKGHIDSFDIYLEDIRRLYDIITKENPAAEVFLLGESMGALISFVMTGLHPGLFGGLICLSPAFGNRMKFSLGEYIKMFSALLYNPKKQFKMPFDSAMCTRDVEYQKVMDEDPREYRSASSKLLWEIAVAQTRAGILKNRIKTDVLFFLSGKDMLVDSEASKKIFRGIKTGNKELIEYPDMYHALSIELGRERVFEDILEWMRKRL